VSSGRSEMARGWAVPRARSSGDVRVRFAPSPTGDLHVGGAWTALASWDVARRAGGAVVVRVEDLDSPRVVKGAEGRILEDLRWLGLEWDEGPGVGGPCAPYTQSARAPLYEGALACLAARGLTYACDCSRAEIARVASAPHAGEEVRYPGTCRDADPARRMKRAPAIRLRVPPGEIAFEDGVMGRFSHDVAREIGDFVLRRGDGVYAYQLAVIVDDLAMGITDVVRGADLLGSTPRQMLLAGLLGADEVPRYRHVPLVLATDGSRLAKRTPNGTVRELRGAGLAPDEVRETLLEGLGLRGPQPRWAREPWMIPAAWRHRPGQAS
jgi:glutamyl-tRNA synthetase